MAVATVSISRSIDLVAGAVGKLDITLMLVLVVLNMLGSSATFEMAIPARRSPSELHWKKHYEKDEKPATHGVPSVAAHSG